MADPITIASIVGAAASAKTLLSSNKPPAIKPPTPMPDTEALALAKRRKAAELSAKSGRASTILSEGDKLGG